MQPRFRATAASEQIRARDRGARMQHTSTTVSDLQIVAIENFLEKCMNSLRAQPACEKKLNPRALTIAFLYPPFSLLGWRQGVVIFTNASSARPSCSSCLRSMPCRKWLNRQAERGKALGLVGSERGRLAWPSPLTPLHTW